MGWWGYDLFSGDSICDWESEHLYDLGELIDETIKKGDWYTKDGKRGYSKEDIPGMIFVYAELAQRYTKRTGNLEKYAKWCKDYKAEGWNHNKEREEIVHRLGEEISNLFQKQKEGYQLDPNKAPKVDIVGTDVYHLTKKENLAKITKTGLKKKVCYAGFFENRKGVYVSRSILGCLKWQHHVLGHKLIADAAFVKFTILPTDKVYQDVRVDFKDDFVVSNNIETTRLTTFC
jgi:hypothetical protein